jgi:hypothetical protein
VLVIKHVHPLFFYISLNILFSLFLSFSFSLNSLYNVKGFNSMFDFFFFVVLILWLWIYFLLCFDFVVF